MEPKSFRLVCGPVPLAPDDAAQLLSQGGLSAGAALFLNGAMVTRLHDRSADLREADRQVRHALRDCEELLERTERLLRTFGRGDTRRS